MGTDDVSNDHLVIELTQQASEVDEAEAEARAVAAKSVVHGPEWITWKRLQVASGQSWQAVLERVCELKGINLDDPE